MTPALLPTADALFAAMGINEPLPRVDYVTTRPIEFDMGSLTAQERQWIDEAQREQAEMDRADAELAKVSA